MEFIEMLRKSHSDKESKSQKTIESMQMHDPFSMGKAMAILNTIGNVDDYTLFKILNGLHKLESKAAFIMMNPERQRVWMDLVTSIL